MSLGLPIALVVLTALGLAILLLPLLWRPRAPAAREAYNIAVYRDQLAEVERDAARGLLDGGQAEAARTEIGRRILALDPPAADRAGSARPAMIVVAAVLLLPLAALLLYARLGAPMLPDQPFASRGAAKETPVAGQTPHIDMQEALSRLRAHLKDRPDDLTGWLLLARSEVGLEHYPAAVEAYRRAVDLSGHRAEIVGDWGEAQVLAAGGTVTPGARDAFTAALKEPQSAPRSRYYLALAKMQQGDLKGALQGWAALAADSPTGADWLPLVRQRIAEAAGKLGIDPATLKPSSGAAPAGMPSPETVAAAAKAAAGATDEQRLAMIETMVERLAARLAQQPDDDAGWTQLGRSYMVLGQPDKARDAYQHAVRLKPEDAALHQALAEATAAAKAEPAPPAGR